VTLTPHNALAPRECERQSGVFLNRDTPGPPPKKHPRTAVKRQAFECARQSPLTPALIPAFAMAITAAALLLASPAAAQPVADSPKAQAEAPSTFPAPAPAPADFDPCAQPPPSNATAPEAQRYFENLEPQCLRNPAYYRQHGQWLLKQRNPSAAIEALERALLLAPEHLGTQLDYAQALIVMGDVDSATALLSALQAQPNVPPPIAALLAAQLQALNQLAVASATPAPQGLTSRVMFSQSVGRDTNLNNASSASNIILTYPELDLNLPLQDASRPRSGATASTALQWTGLLPMGRQVWLFQAKGQARQTSTAANRYEQAEFGATWLQDPAAPQQWIARAEHTQLRWGNRKLYSSEKLSLQHQWVYNAKFLNLPNTLNCRTAVGAELEDRAFPGSRATDGLYRGATFSLVCQDQSSLSIQLSTGLDQPHQAGRVGGAQRQHELRAQWQFSAVGNQWQAEYSYQRQQDTTGYSPLLARNAIRRVSRQAVRFETSRPTQWAAIGSPQWFGSVELTHQSSNLQLFASSRNAAQTGLRWLWP